MFTYCLLSATVVYLLSSYVTSQFDIEYSLEPINMFRILFLWTGNSGLSQMDTVFARLNAKSNVEVVCASDKPHKIHAVAVDVMKELGLNIRTDQNPIIQIS